MKTIVYRFAKIFRQYISICKLHMMVSIQFSCRVLNPQVPSRAGRVALRFQTGASFVWGAQWIPWGAFWKGDNKMLKKVKKDGCFFFNKWWKIHGMFDMFFFEHFIYIYMCRFYMFLYVFKYVYMCFFFHLEKWEKRPQEVLFGSSKKRPKTWRMAPLGVICKFEVSFLHPRNLR